jgi:hypothetical protein
MVMRSRENSQKINERFALPLPYWIENRNPTAESMKGRNVTFDSASLATVSGHRVRSPQLLWLSYP